MNPQINRWFTPSTYILVIIALFLPFCHFKCGGMKLAQVKGVDMIVRGKATASPMIERLGGGKGFGSKEKEGLDKDELRVKFNIWVALSTLLALVGLIVHFTGMRPQHTIQLVLAVVGILALVVFVFTRNSFFGLDALGAEDGELGGRGIISIGLGIGFWLSVAGFVASAVFNFKDRSPVPVNVDEIGTGYPDLPPVPGNDPVV